MNFKRVLATVLTAAALGAVFTGCKSTAGGSGTQSALNAAKIINIGDQPSFFIFKIAQAKGYFKKEFGSDIKVNVISYVKQGPAVVESMASKNIDLAMLGTLPIVTANANGKHMIALASGNYSKNGFAIFANPYAEVKKVEDLKGKTLGVPFGTNDHEVAVELFERHDLRPSDVKLMDMQASDALVALKKGNISAALLKGNDLNSAKKAGEIEIANNSETGPVANMLVGRKAFIDANPKLTQKFIKACSESAKYVESHPAESIKISAKMTGSTIADTKISYKSRIRLVSIDGEYFAKPLMKSVNFAKKQGIIDENITYNQITATSFFSKAGI